MKTRTIVIICIGILLAAGLITSFIFMSEPTAQSEGASKQMAMLVEVVPAEKGNFRPVITGTGTVEPVEDIVLSPLVGGEVIRRSPAFTPGGFVEEGTVLLQIDPADYRNTLRLRESERLQRQTDLEMEMGRQQVAQQDLQLVGGDSLSREERSLVLRQPQLNAVKAEISAAEAAVEQARLNLARTTIRAPFEAHILSQNVTEGSQVAPGDNLGRLVGSQHYRVILTLPVSKLQWLKFPANETEEGSPVRIRNTTAWAPGQYREGTLDKQVGALDDRSRLARVLILVPDPLARTQESKPELMIGAFVEAQITGEEISDVVRINRDYLRTNNTVWVMKDEKLEIRDTEVVLTDMKYAYISKGLKEDENIVTTNLSTVTEGTPLRTSGAEKENSQQQ